MSTDYALRRPLAAATIRRRTGWRTWKNENGHGLTDGENFVHTTEDAKGRVIGYVRYGANDCSSLDDALRSVSEYDDDDPDYKRVFGTDWIEQ